MNQDRVFEIIQQVKQLAKEYKQETGKPLGVTGEVAEYEVARILDLRLCDARQTGYDAEHHVGNLVRRIQIKGRCTNNASSNQRVPAIRLDCDFDIVMLVLLNENLEATEIYEASKAAVLSAISHPGSRARNERRQLSVRVFKRIAKKVWPTS